MKTVTKARMCCRYARSENDDTATNCATCFASIIVSSFVDLRKLARRKGCVCRQSYVQLYLSSTDGSKNIQDHRAPLQAVTGDTHKQSSLTSLVRKIFSR